MSLAGFIFNVYVLDVVYVVGLYDITKIFITIVLVYLRNIIKAKYKYICHDCPVLFKVKPRCYLKLNLGVI